MTGTYFYVYFTYSALCDNKIIVFSAFAWMALMGGYVSGTLMSVLQSHVSTAPLAMTTSTLTHVTAPPDFLALTVRPTTRIAQPAHASMVANALMGSTTLLAGACTVTLAPIARPECLPAPTTCAEMVVHALRTPTAIRDATASMDSKATGVSR